MMLVGLDHRSQKFLIPSCTPGTRRRLLGNVDDVHDVPSSVLGQHYQSIHRQDIIFTASI
jgi:hypothetical protein